MNPKRKIIVVVAVVVAVGVGAYFVNRNWIKPVTAQQAAPGDFPTAPNFTLTDIFGQKLSLDQYQGKVILLDFWATWCGPCRSEIPGFIKLQQQYGNRGLQIIGISEDEGGVAPVLHYYQQVGMDYPVAIDNGKVGELYGGIIGLPTTFLIGRDMHVYEKIPGAVGADYFKPQITTLLAASPQQAMNSFQVPEGSETAHVETMAEVDSTVPGVDVSKLTKVQLGEYMHILRTEKCTCGCNESVLECRRTDPACTASLREAQEALKKVLQDPADH